MSVFDNLVSKNELKKIVFISLDDPAPAPAYTALVNPQSFSLNYAVGYDQQTEGVPEGERRYSQHAAPTLTFELLFDATGVIPPAAGGALDNIPIAGAIASAFGSAKKKNASGIAQDLENFEKVVYKYHGELHRPKQVRIDWGNGLMFEGVLTALNYQFKLFKADGTPLRATANVTFISNVEASALVQYRNDQSSDLTHQRTVQEGDTLPLMAHRIYGDATLYLKVAKFNNLLNFRRIQPGTQLFFPPLNQLKA